MKNKNTGNIGKVYHPTRKEFSAAILEDGLRGQAIKVKSRGRGLYGMNHRRAKGQVMKLDNKTGIYSLTMYDIDYMFDYPYGVGITSLTIKGEIENCQSIVRAALYRAKRIL